MTERALRQAGEATVRRWAVDMAMLVAIGLLMAFLGPFASERVSLGVRYAYWMICMVGGGVIAVVADDLLLRRAPHPWRRAALVSVLATPLVTLLVLTTQHVMLDGHFNGWAFGVIVWQVWVILAAVLAVRTLVWRRAPTRIETRTVVAAPLPEAEAAFRRRLSAKRRAARLIAVEAHDHYLRVHTDVGVEMITLRFADALNELTLAHGWRVHRSWWIAADAVETVRWRRGAGEARLAGGVVAPVSRSYAPTLREAGWR